MVAGRKEAVTPPELLERLLRAAGDQLVLIGGQALGYWLQHYGLVIPETHAAISADTDFLTPSAADADVVRKFARILGGEAYFPNERALTALVGQAYFVVSDDEFINVDVVFDVFGMDPAAVRRRAVKATLGQDVFLVMHPLDVLQSRLANLYKLAEKQNPLGVMQMALAIDMAREFIRAEADAARSTSTMTRSPIQGLVSAIERMALDDAGRKVAMRYALHVADAIDPSRIPAGAFWDKRWPTIEGLMSPAYAARFSPPLA